MWREKTERTRKDHAPDAECREEAQKIGARASALDGVLEFLDESAAGDLRSGSVLSDEVYVLQFSYRSGVFDAVFALCGGRLSGDSWAPGIVSGGACGVGGGIRERRCGYGLYRRRDA